MKMSFKCFQKCENIIDDNCKNVLYIKIIKAVIYFSL